MTINSAPGFPKLGAVSIELDKPRTLRWTHECIRTVEREGGINLLNARAEDAARLASPDLTLLSAMLFGALKHEDRRLTIEDCDQFIYDHDPEEILTKVAEVYAAGMPKRKGSGKAATPDPLTPPSAGPSDSPSPATI